MSGRQLKAHKAYLSLKRPFNPTEVYTEMCQLVGCKTDAIDRGLGQLFREGKLKPPEERKPKKHKPSRSSGADDFR